MPAPGHPLGGPTKKSLQRQVEYYRDKAAKIRAGMRSSTWQEDLVDPGLLLDLLEKIDG